MTNETKFKATLYAIIQIFNPWKSEYNEWLLSLFGIKEVEMCKSRDRLQEFKI